MKPEGQKEMRNIEVDETTRTQQQQEEDQPNDQRKSQIVQNIGMTVSQPCQKFKNLLDHYRAGVYKPFHTNNFTKNNVSQIFDSAFQKIDSKNQPPIPKFRRQKPKQVEIEEKVDEANSKNKQFIQNRNFLLSLQNQGRTQIICCRTSFFDKQQIKEPESQILEFKKYRLPFSKNHYQQLCKTICAFLNNKGGIIFLGVQENIITKQHIIKGEYINECQKEQFLKIMRANVCSIEPDILINHKMKIVFVPVRASEYPFKFLQGRFVIKIVIEEGIRDQIYTYRNDEGEGLMTVRTENQVLTYNFKRDFRKILAAQKERAQNPLCQSMKLHKNGSSECLKPEEGDRVFNTNNRFLKIFKKKEKKEKQQQMQKQAKMQKQLKHIKQQKQQKPNTIEIADCKLITVQNLCKNPLNTKEIQPQQSPSIIAPYKTNVMTQNSPLKNMFKKSISKNSNNSLPLEELNEEIKPKVYDIIKKLKAVTQNDHKIYGFENYPRQIIKSIIYQKLPCEKNQHRWGTLGSTYLIWEFDSAVEDQCIEEIFQKIAFIDSRINHFSRQTIINTKMQNNLKLFYLLSTNLKILFEEDKEQKSQIRSKKTLINLIAMKYQGSRVVLNTEKLNSILETIEISSSTDNDQTSKNQEKSNKSSSKLRSETKTFLEQNNEQEKIEVSSLKSQIKCKSTSKINQEQNEELWEFKNLEASLGAYLAIKSKNINVMFFHPK